MSLSKRPLEVLHVGFTSAHYNDSINGLLSVPIFMAPCTTVSSHLNGYVHSVPFIFMTSSSSYLASNKVILHTICFRYC